MATLSLILVTISRNFVVKGTPDRPLARDFSKFSEENFIHDLSRIDWVDIVSRNETNIHKAFSSFYNKLNKRGLSFVY